MSGSFAWYLARASGMVAWALLAGSVVWGLSITTGVLQGRPRPAWQLDLHRYLGGLATIFVGVHIAGIVADTYVHFGATSVLVPFASSWKPLAIAWGVTAMYLLVAVELSSLARAKLPKRLWRGMHYATLPLFAVATIHALTAGTDAKTWEFESVLAVAVMLVGGLTSLRVAGGARTRPAVRRATIAR